MWKESNEILVEIYYINDNNIQSIFSTTDGSTTNNDSSGAALLTMMSLIQVDMKELKKNYKSTDKKLNMVLEAVNSLQRQPPADTVEDLPGPASTLEDLNDLVKKPHELVRIYFKNVLVIILVISVNITHNGWYGFIKSGITNVKWRGRKQLGVES